jgi:hypothetical protein
MAIETIEDQQSTCPETSTLDINAYRWLPHTMQVFSLIQDEV